MSSADTQAGTGGDLVGVASSAWRRIRPVAESTWFLGPVVALVAWNVSFASPIPGFDPSWLAGLYMAAHDGLHWGTQMVFTYGPLGFLAQPVAYYGDLAAISFLFNAALLVALCTSLVWAVRRSFNAPIAVLVTFAVVAGLPYVVTVLVLAAIWCLAALSSDPPPYVRQIVVFGGGALAAVECLIRLNFGPAVLLMCAVALVALPTRRRDLIAFGATAVATFAALWFASGQALGNLSDFVSSSAQVVLGYNQAMALDSASIWYLLAAIEVAAMLVLWSVLSAPKRRRLAAGFVMAIAAFAIYKEGVVRFDGSFHLASLFATATALTLAIPWPRLLRPAAVVTFALAGGLALATVLPNTGQNLDPISHIQTFANQVRDLADPGRRDALAESGRSQMRGYYRVDPRMLAALRGHSVEIDPWEAGVAWAYGLRWQPLPVFHVAYTASLDQHNASALAAASAPRRILREDVSGAAPALGVAYMDGRFAGWDSPAAKLAMLCHYKPLETTNRWQVLAKTADRCGQTHFLSSAKTAYGQTVAVPSAPKGDVVFARIHGAGVSGLESIRSLLLRAKLRYVTVNRGLRYRLVPGTAGDGLIMSVPRRADFPGRGFSLSPAARTLSLTGASGDLIVDFYAMPIRAEN